MLVAMINKFDKSIHIRTAGVIGSGLGLGAEPALPFRRVHPGALIVLVARDVIDAFAVAADVPIDVALTGVPANVPAGAIAVPIGD